jgi:uncharacterized protein YbcV (DUF1398 family)
MNDTVQALREMATGIAKERKQIQKIVKASKRLIATSVINSPRIICREKEFEAFRSALREAGVFD